jgi:SP family general alpha glucoside:H+ symporter-like MFS transporter
MGSIPVVLFIIREIGFLGNRKSDYAVGSLLIFLNFVYNATLGPS